MKLNISRGAIITMMEFMAKQDVRYYLNGMCFLPDGRVAATDGHTMATARHSNEISEPHIVRVHRLPTKAFDRAEIDTDTNIVTLFRNDVRAGVAMSENIDGRFPDVDRVIPKEQQAVEEIGFNAGYLSRVEKVAKVISPKFNGVKLTFNGSTNAVKCSISWCDDDVTIILMPMRL